jgi:hypothetical protein
LILFLPLAELPVDFLYKLSELTSVQATAAARVGFDGMSIEAGHGWQNQEQKP